MIKMLLNLTDGYDRLIIKNYSNKTYELMVFGALNDLDEDGNIMYSHQPKASFEIKSEDMKAFIEKVKDDLEVKP